MNTKDRNLIRALVILTVTFLVIASAINVGLRISGDALRLVGALTCAYFAIRGAIAVKNRLKAPLNLRKAGDWAIVTGCTGGLGQEYARGLAKRGMNLILISRSETKLQVRRHFAISLLSEMHRADVEGSGPQALAEELRTTYEVRAEYLAFDFAKGEGEDTFYEETLPTFLAKSPVNGDVALLVNNVGVGDEAPLYAHELPLREANMMIKVNCGATVNMTRVLAPLFADRKRGAILNISSGSATQPTPLLSTYAATKAFIAHFSKSVAREYSEFGVEVLCIDPYYISGTGLYPASKPSLNAPAAYKIVDGSLKALGRYELSHGYLFHEVIGFLLGFVMEDKVFGVFSRVLGDLLGLNGTILKVQKKARARSMSKMPEVFEKLEAEKAAFLGKLGRR
mmetsp:Transcript_8284/g.31155  ORF Transcript_8284/g.31155 Transcript_8284/m.31155 type:complete len:397 (-) Transcript_8284:68-1258(-)